MSMNYNSAHKHYFIHFAVGEAKAKVFALRKLKVNTWLLYTTTGEGRLLSKKLRFFGQWLALDEKGSFWEKFPKPCTSLLHLYLKWSNIKEINF